MNALFCALLIKYHYIKAGQEIIERVTRGAGASMSVTIAPGWRATTRPCHWTFFFFFLFSLHTQTLFNAQSWANSGNRCPPPLTPFPTAAVTRRGLLWDRNQVTSSALLSLMSLPWILASHQFFMTGMRAMVILFLFSLLQHKQCGWQTRGWRQKTAV